MTWLLNLGFAGGNAAVEYDHRVVRVDAERDILFVHRWTDEMEVIYTAPDALKKLTLDWTDWLGDALISSVTWTADPTSLSLSNTSNTNTAATVYMTTNGTNLNEEYRLDCQIVTDDAIARTEDRSVMVHVVRKWA